MFYEDYKIYDQGDWFYLTALPYFYPVAPPTGYYMLNGQEVCGCQSGAVFVPGPVTSNNPNVRPLGDAFFNDITRGYRQKAAYASVDVELVPQVLTLTAGTRYFNTNTTEVGAIAGSFGCQLASNPPNPCIDHNNFTNLNEEGLDRTYSGFRSRANLSWKPSEDALLYYTWSQGFRAGGFNRSFGTPSDSPLANPAPDRGKRRPMSMEDGARLLAYGPDTLTNNELGWKTTWLDRALQWDGAVYQEEWNQAQIDAFASRVLAGATINGGNYRVRGVETFAQARVCRRVDPRGGCCLESQRAGQRSAHFSGPTEHRSISARCKPPPAKSSPIRRVRSAVRSPARRRSRATSAHAMSSPSTPIARLPRSASCISRTHSLPPIGSRSTCRANPSLTTCRPSPPTMRRLVRERTDGVVQVYGENLTDTRAELFANYSLGYKAVTVNRPRTIGLRFSYKSSGE